MLCRKWAADPKSCPDQSQCRYLHRKVFDPHKDLKAMPAKLQAEAEPKAKAKAKAKKAMVAKLQDDEVAFTEVMNDCDYPREES